MEIIMTSTSQVRKLRGRKLKFLQITEKDLHLETLYQKHPSQKKRAGGVAQGVGPEFKPQYHQKKKKERKKERS
jgi:hypothetical protein